MAEAELTSRVATLYGYSERVVKDAVLSMERDELLLRKAGNMLHVDAGYGLRTYQQISEKAVSGVKAGSGVLFSRGGRCVSGVVESVNNRTALVKCGKQRVRMSVRSLVPLAVPAPLMDDVVAGKVNVDTVARQLADESAARLLEDETTPQQDLDMLWKTLFGSAVVRVYWNDPFYMPDKVRDRKTLDWVIGAGKFTEAQYDEVMRKLADEGYTLEVFEQFPGAGFGPDEALSEQEDADPENDIFINDDWLTAYYAGKQIVAVDDPHEIDAAIRDWMEKNTYWPSVWWVSDHGNVHPYKLEAAAPPENELAPRMEDEEDEEDEYEDEEGEEQPPSRYAVPLYVRDTGETVWDRTDEWNDSHTVQATAAEQVGRELLVLFPAAEGVVDWDWDVVTDRKSVV